jgi:hypothetical protein
MTFTEEPGHDHEDEFADFEELLGRGTRFVLLTEDAPTKEHEHTHDERKRMALWMKKHKGSLRHLVAAMIVVEQKPLKRVAIKSFGPAFQAFWGYPIVVASGREEALTVASGLLNDR